MTEARAAAAVPASHTLPSLLYSEDEEQLRASIRRLLADRSPWTTVLQRTESGATADRNLWHALTRELGVGGLPVSEQLGGAGATWRETGVVLEELGRAVAPVPYLGSAVIATALASAIEAHELLGELATGAATAALAAGFAVLTGPGMETDAELRGGRLHASVPSVADALIADTLLVPTRAGEIVQVDATDPALRIEPVVSLDMTRQLANVTISGAAARTVAHGEQARSGLRAAATVGAALLASEQLGVAEWCLDATVAYLRQRRQFGRLLGSYQALKHRCADLWVEISQARAVARYAAGCAADGDPDLPVAAALAQAHCSLVAVNAAEQCVQLHGGIGFTWEYPPHLYLKRARSSALALGPPDVHRARLGALVGIGPAEGAPV